MCKLLQEIMAQARQKIFAVSTYPCLSLIRYTGIFVAIPLPDYGQQNAAQGPIQHVHVPVLMGDSGAVTGR